MGVCSSYHPRSSESPVALRRGTAAFADFNLVSLCVTVGGWLPDPLREDLWSVGSARSADLRRRGHTPKPHAALLAAQGRAMGINGRHGGQLVAACSEEGPLRNVIPGRYILPRSLRIHESALPPRRESTGRRRRAAAPVGRTAAATAPCRTGRTSACLPRGCPPPAA